MRDTITVQMAQRGLVTLPKELRKNYKLKPGDTFTLLDLGGVFLLSPQRTQVDQLADEVRQELVEGGESLESMLKALRADRERYEPETGPDDAPI